MDGPAGMELHAHAVGARGGMTESVVADGSEAAREDAPEVARDKLHAGKGADPAAKVVRAVHDRGADFGSIGRMGSRRCHGYHAGLGCLHEH